MSKAPVPLLECIVNVSEGRDATTLGLLAAAIDTVPECYLLHRDVGRGAHRTVFTFAGPPEAVFEAAYGVYRVAAERIDMRVHEGTHPRSGAVDVCPFVPISGVTQAEAVAGTQVLAGRVAHDFGLPVYLYAESALTPNRKSLTDVRRGQFEGLSDKLARAEWAPDYGPGTPHPTLGITVMGVRPFLIAWNINLCEAATLTQAGHLAARLRGSGSKGRPGLFPGLKAIGWYIEEYGRCQISCNVVDADNTSLTRVYLTATELARSAGIRVTGSELIGLIPSRHLRAAARDFCFGEVTEEEVMETAVSVLGLDDLEPFNWRQRTLETVYRDAGQRDRRS